MNPTVSVVIPHYNRSDLLRDAVNSVLKSDYPAFEIIVIDDGSSEEEFRRATQLTGKKVRVLKRTDGQKGPSRCRNIGVAESRSDLIIFLDSDDLLARWCIAERLKYAASATDADCWVFPVLLFSSTPLEAKHLWNQLETGEDDAIRFARSDPPWHTSSVIWKKSAFLRIGGFDENVFYGDDSDLHLRALLSGLRVSKFPDALPDAFVRRSEAPRITNSASTELLNSRLRRLSAGTRFLKSAPSLAPYLRVWAGQYFMEGEFLLFNIAQPRPHLSQLLSLWRQDAPGPRRWLHLAAAYFQMAVALKRNAYFLLRLERRVARSVLPEFFFPRAGGFETAKPDEQTLTALQFKLEAGN